MGLSYVGKCDHKLAIKCFEESLNIKKNNIVSNSNIDGEQNTSNEDKKE